MQALALADKELNPELFFKLTNTCRHIGLNPMKTFRRTRDASFPHNGRKYPEIGKFHNHLNL